MLFIDNEGVNDPRINLALEEYVARNFDSEEDYVLFYINQPSLIIGKHQNTIEEINTDYVKEKKIIVVRRVSGGGTVYHDFGNLNFSFLTQYDKSKVNNFKQFNQPIIEALHSLNIPAEMTGRNDIVVEGKKVSGNAQFSTTKKMFSHGTLLFNSEMQHLSQALKVKPDKIESKGVKSVRSRVANLTSFLKEELSLEGFRKLLLEFIFDTKGEIPTRKLTQEEWAEVHQLSEEKYQTWEWNYGRSPAFNIQKIKRFEFGEVDARIQVGEVNTKISVKEGKIVDINFYGDFLGHGDLLKVQNTLIGTRYEQNHIKATLQNIDLKNYFGDISAEEFAVFLCD